MYTLNVEVHLTVIYVQGVPKEVTFRIFLDCLLMLSAPAAIPGEGSRKGEMSRQSREILKVTFLGHTACAKCREILRTAQCHFQKGQHRLASYLFHFRIYELVEQSDLQIFYYLDVLCQE